MKPLLLVVVLAVVGFACTDEAPDPQSARPEQTAHASDPSVPPSAESAPQTPSREADIYAAVIRQLGSEMDLARRYEVIYLVAGEVADAGKPRGNPFGPPLQGFGDDVLAGIRQQIADALPPLRFVDEGRDTLRKPDRPGLVKRGGVLIALGPIEKTKRCVHVPNTVWCGGKCSRWQTYVVSQRNARWVVTGNSGPVVAS